MAQHSLKGDGTVNCLLKTFPLHPLHQIQTYALLMLEILLLEFIPLTLYNKKQVNRIVKGENHVFWTKTDLDSNPNSAINNWALS